MSLKISYLGHATVRVESDGTSFLTDPLFSSRVLWIRREVPLVIDPGSLTPPNAIFVSHAHLDHLDIPSYKYFPSTVPIFTPPGIGKLLGKFLKNRIIEIEPGSSFEIQPGLKVTAFSVRHRGFRLLPFRYTKCNGYLVEINGKTVFFAGDTAYRDFKPACHGKQVDLALLPIGAYKPAWLMKGRHTNPAEAVQIFEDINAKFMIPIHWGTFKSQEPLEEPPAILRNIVSEKGLTHKVKILPPGESYELTCAPSTATDPKTGVPPLRVVAENKP